MHARYIGKSLGYIILGLFIIIMIVVVIRTLTINKNIGKEYAQVNNSMKISLDDVILKHFLDGLRFRTISYSKDRAEYEEMKKYANYIISAYPAIHSSKLVKRYVISDYSIIYHIRGSDTSLIPYLFSTHMDVVPADETKWISNPFEANILDGYIYARGSLDYKNAIHGILEALEYLLTQRFIPKRSFFICIGHDEELGGWHGAEKISEFIQNQLHIGQVEFVIDEGTIVAEKMLSFITDTIALIGVSEKGSAFVELSVTHEGGHSSMPVGESSTGILAKAVHRLESNPFPSMLSTGGIEQELLEVIATNCRIPYKMVLNNLWLFKPLITWIFSRSPGPNAFIRTTTLVTMLRAGVKENVIPPNATAVVNHRIHPLQTVKQVLDYDRRVINDERVKLRLLSGMEPHFISGYGDDDFGYQSIKRSILQVLPHVLVSPSIMIANTDSFHYFNLTRNIYRFGPSRVTMPQLKGIHGNNERTLVQNYEETINFYYHLIINSDAPSVSHLHQRHNEL